MLMSTKSNRYAHQLLKARAAGTSLQPLTTTGKITVEDAYEIAKCTHDSRIAQGEVPIGRKIGFSNRKMWPLYGASAPLTEPIWAPLFESSVEFAMDNVALHCLKKAQQPRIEPEIVFKLSRTPEADITLDGMADCLEWMAHGFEVVVSPYPDWKFEPADAVAAFGLHRALIVGEPRLLSSQTRRNLAQVLGCATVSLSCADTSGTSLRAAGFGSDVLDSPLHALWNLHQQLQKQTTFTQLQAGELITTGSWTDALPVKRGEIWSSAFSQISLAGLNLSFS